MEEYITNNMPLVVYLSIEGHTAQRMERHGRRCVWVFADVGNLMELIDSYFSEESMVDVREAIEVGARIRNEMYDFMQGSRA